MAGSPTATECLANNFAKITKSADITKIFHTIFSIFTIFSLLIFPINCGNPHHMAIPREPTVRQEALADVNIP